jgi:hypothetical protein
MQLNRTYSVIAWSTTQIADGRVSPSAQEIKTTIFLCNAKTTKTAVTCGL